MNFVYEGTYDDRPVSGSVSGGVHTGHPHVVIAVQALVDGGARVGIGPVTGAASLTDGRLAHATIAAVVDSVRFGGQAPGWGELPEGAVS
jgi:hypothetical protein